MRAAVRSWNEMTGAAGVLLVAGALFLPGAPPKATDTADQLTSNLSMHRGALVAGIILAGPGFMALLWFVGVVSGWLRSQESERGTPESAAAIAGGVMGMSLMLVGMLIFSGVAFRAVAMNSPASVRVAVDTGNMLIEASKYGIAVLLLAVCAGGKRRATLPRWMLISGVTAAALLVVSTVPPFVDTAGIGQFGGGIDVIGGIPGFAWLAGLSIVMTREAAADSSHPT